MSIDPPEEPESDVLASFARRNKETGAPEVLRITSGDFNGRQVTHFRIYFKGCRPTPGDDGFRPTKQGITIRETELDEAIQALEAAREIARQAGRSTCRDEADERTPRPQMASPEPRPTRQSRKSSAAREVQQDAFDDLAEYRR